MADQLEKRFQETIQQVRSNPNKNEPSSEIKLRFYAYYKQAIEGNCTSKQPCSINLIDRAKWDAWYSLINISQDEAKQGYINLFNAESI